MKPKTKRDKSVGRTMWASAKAFVGRSSFFAGENPDLLHDPMPVLILPLSNPEAIIERRAAAIFSDERKGFPYQIPWEKISKCEQEDYKSCARATLVSDGWVDREK